MKKARKLLSIILCLALTLCLALPALADDGEIPTYTLTINSETPNHDYEAYQIFSGELAEVPDSPGSVTLINIDWGTGVQNKPGLLAAIQSITIGSEKPFENCDDASAVADQLATYEDDAEALDIFADTVADFLVTSPPAEASTIEQEGVGGEKEYVATFSGLQAGYYLVKEAEFTGTEGDNNAYTKFILEIVNSTTIEAKAEVPTLDKQVSNTPGDANYADTAATSVGSTVYFKLTSKVPEMDGYNKYFFIVNDTLSGGLTFNNDVKITIGGTQLTKDTHYTVTLTPAIPTPGTPTSVEIVFKDFIDYKDANRGQDITITYSAMVNEHAVVGSDPNTNSATLTYSNDPNHEYVGQTGPGGNPDKPDPDKDKPVGTTPNTVSAVYVTAIQIQKVDTSGNVLTGAGFTLTGTGVIKTGVTRFDDFEVDNDDGTYYLLADEVTYTKTPPASEDDENYKLPIEKYSPVEDTTDWDETTAEKTVTGMVGSTGVLKFEGLGTGEYTIAETTVPENYNKIDEITVTITFTPPATLNEPCIWSAKFKIGNDTERTADIADDGTILLTIENRSGAELPSTGGIGTTIFVYGGIILMVLALGVVAVRTYSRKKNA